MGVPERDLGAGDAALQFLLDRLTGLCQLGVGLPLATLSACWPLWEGGRVGFHPQGRDAFLPTQFCQVRSLGRIFWSQVSSDPRTYDPPGGRRFPSSGLLSPSPPRSSLPAMFIEDPSVSDAILLTHTWCRPPGGLHSPGAHRPQSPSKHKSINNKPTLLTPAPQTRIVVMKEANQGLGIE